MIYIVQMEAKSLWKNYLAWMCCTALFLTAFMVLFPEVKNSVFLSGTAKSAGRIPIEILKAFGWMPSMDLTKIEGYFPFLFFYLTSSSSIFASMLSSSAISREEEDGTILFLSSQPLSRGHIFWGKWLAHVVAYGIFSLLVFALSLALLFLLSESGKEAFYSQMATQMVMGLFFAGLIFISLGIMISSFLSDVVLANGAALLCSGALVVGGMFGRALEKNFLGFLGEYTFFPISFLVHGLSLEKYGPDLFAVFAGILSILIFLGLGYGFFLFKDLAFDPWESIEDTENYPGP